MESYGLVMQGRLIVEQVQSKPKFTSQDIGRMIHVRDDDSYYLGGNNKWIALSTGNKLNSQFLDFGLGDFQINASNIPIVNTLDYFETGCTVNRALETLATGYAIQNNSIFNRSIAPSTIGPEKINWGYETSQISSKNIPIVNNILDSGFVSSNMTLQDAFDNLSTYSPTIIRKTVQLNNWSYNVNGEEYFVTLYTSPIKQNTVLVQCYDNNGQAIIPSRIDSQLTGTNRKITIWSPYKLILYVVIVG